MNMFLKLLANLQTLGRLDLEPTINQISDVYKTAQFTFMMVRSLVKYIFSMESLISKLELGMTLQVQTEYMLQ